MRYELVSFDLWFTLITDPTLAAPAQPEQGAGRVGSERHDHRVDAFVACLAESGQSVERVEVSRVMRKEWARYHRVHFEQWRTLSNPERIADMTRRLGCPPLPDALVRRLDDELAESLFARAPVLVDGMAELLRDLARQAHLVLISDTSYSPGRTLRRLLDQAGVLGLFETLTFSDEVGMAKPDPRVFEHTVAAIGLADRLRDGPPLRAVHIGDREKTDIKGAKSVGWEAALFEGALPPKLRKSYDDTTADRVVDSVGALRDWLFRD